MHEELNAPDPAGCWVRSRLDVPGWELLGKSADPGPVAGASEIDGFFTGGAEGGDLGGGEDGGDEDEAVPV